MWVTDANGVTVTNTFDDVGRLISRVYPDTGAETFGYSAAGLIAYTNQIGNKNYYVYNTAGWKIFETNANHELLQFQYDSSGNLTNLVDDKGHSTRWNYNEYGLVTNKLDQAGAEILRYTYDPGGRLTNRWSAAKTNTVYAYDPVGNLTDIDYHSSPSVGLQYDSLNRLRIMVDAVGTTEYSYQPGGLLLSEDNPFPSAKLTNGYVNRLRTALGLQQPTGMWHNDFYYDGARRLSTVSSPAGVFQYYFPSGLPSRLPVQLSLPNSAAITNSYDPVARLTATFLRKNNGTALFNHEYIYDPAGRRTNQVIATTRTVAYHYDNIGQLIVADNSYNPEDRGYEYDSAWNLKYRTNYTTLNTFTVDSKNQLLSALGTNCTYDANGNLTQYGTQYYAYDDENRLIQWFRCQINPFQPTNGDLRTDFVYDGLGRLRKRLEYTGTPPMVTNPPPPGGEGPLQREPPGEGPTWGALSQIWYLYDGKRVIQERDSNNVPVVSYTRGTDLSGTLEGAGGIGGLLGRSSGYSGGNWTSHAYYLADGNGNITCMTDTGQNRAAIYYYDPFGSISSQSGTLCDSNVYRFSSKEIHAPSGMYYYLYRFYDPNLQRWINRDPIGELGGNNLYDLVLNNPVDYTDAFGLNSQNGDKGFWGGLWDWMKNVPSRAKDAAGAVKQWCKTKCPGIGSAGAGAATRVISTVADAAKTGPGLTAILDIEAACRKCKECEGDCDEDGSCARACKQCEDGKERMGGHIGGL